jgi:Protein of unknown function (DUF541)
MRLLRVCVSFLVVGAPGSSIAQSASDYPTGVSVSENSQLISIREIATVQAQPDNLYVLMKVQSEAAQLSQAIEQNSRAIKGFTAALAGIGVEPTAVRVTNFVVTPLVLGRGVGFSRNLVIAIPGIEKKSPGEIERLMARIQDLGARYGSQCVTCIGSG